MKYFNSEIGRNTEPKHLCKNLISRMLTDNNALDVAWLIGHRASEKIEVYQEVVSRKMTLREFWRTVEAEAKKEAENIAKIRGIEGKDKVMSPDKVSRMLVRYEPSRILLQEIFGSRTNLVEKLIKKNEKGEIKGQEFEKLKEEIKVVLGEKLNNIKEERREKFVEEFARLCVRIDYHCRRLRIVGDMAKDTFGLFKDKKTWIRGFAQYFIAVALFWTGIIAAIKLIESKPEPFAWLVCNQWAKIGLGTGLTALFIIGLNFEGDWMKSLANPKKYFAEVVKSQVVESTAKKGLSLKDAFKPDKSFALTMILGGFGMVIKELGIPFYTSSELCEKFCNWIKGFNEHVGEVLHKVLSFEIPFLNQSIFDLILGLLLGGPAEIKGDTVIGAVMNMLMEVINGITTQILNMVVMYIADTAVN